MEELYISRVYLKILEFIYLLMASLSLHCCAQSFSSYSKWGLPFIAELASHGSAFPCKAEALGRLGQ